MPATHGNIWAAQISGSGLVRDQWCHTDRMLSYPFRAWWEGGSLVIAYSITVSDRVMRRVKYDCHEYAE